jgi:phage FluMu protein Com
MKKGESVRLPVVAEKHCEECNRLLDISDMFSSIQEPQKEDELGIPEVKVKCPGCGHLNNWDLRFET